MYKISNEFTMLECMECGKIMIVDNEEFVKMFKDGLIISEEEIILADVLDEIFNEDEDECDGDCEFGY